MQMIVCKHSAGHKYNINNDFEQKQNFANKLK